MIHQPESPASVLPARVRLEPVPFHHTLLDGSWSPNSTDLHAELPALVPILEHARGPVKRLLLSAAGWAARPHQIITAGRPALLITEDFALQENGGVLSLAGTGRETAQRAQ